jgi:recombination protein RecA
VKERKRKQVRLDAAVAAIRRRYGPWSVVQGRPAGMAGVPHISTGFPVLDRALEIGGLPRGKLSEMVGPATSGKTTLALKFLAQAQAGGGEVAYIDQALYFDADYAHRCGLDFSRFWVGATHDLLEALATTEALARNSSLVAAVLDVVDLAWTDSRAGQPLAATLNRLPAALARAGMALLVLHESPVGGSPALSALAHNAAVRLQVTRERWIQKQGDVRGYEARVEVLKNQLAPAGRTVTLAIEFNGTVRGDGL